VAACGLGLACVPGAASGDPPTSSRRAPVDRLLLDKSEHSLRAYVGRTLVATYSVSIGTGGLGPKTYEGDGKTPEGTYRIDERHVSSQFHRFLHVSYPNAADRRRHAARRARGEVPEGAAIGGAIGIHGTPSGLASVARAVAFDWTAGCIAVTDAQAEELYRSVAPNATIEIRP